MFLCKAPPTRRTLCPQWYRLMSILLASLPYDRHSGTQSTSAENRYDGCFEKCAKIVFVKARPVKYSADS